MPKKISIDEMVGKKFGRLTVIKYEDTANNVSRWRCLCGCGKETVVYGCHIRSGHTRSCVCLSLEVSTKHGMEGTLIYRIWGGMKSRCLDETNKNYHRYGGRGILVCDRWLKFENFFADMGNKPVGLQLDRIDNDGPYSPENCRWATVKEQANNRRSNRWINFMGMRKTITQWSEYIGISLNVLNARINQRGWSAERAFTEPVRKRVL